MKFLKMSVIILLISLLAVPCFAEVPMLIKYSGELTRVNAKGKTLPYPPGTYNINFFICTDQMCTDVVWSETHYDMYISWGNTRGEFEVTLGEYNPLDVLVFDQDYWLLVTEERKGYSKIEQLLTDPYGMRAEYANKAETVYDSETGEYKNLQDIVINNARHAEEADNADTVDGKHYSDIAKEIDDDVAAHAALTNTHGVIGEIVGTNNDQTLTNKHISGEQIDSGKINNARLNMGEGNGLDADTLDGRHYSEIAEDIESVEVNLNNHKADSNAHHTKTNSFTELNDMATDDQIPDDITINVARGMRALCSAPDNPVAGEIYLQTCPGEDKKVFVYTGSDTGWKALDWE